MGQTEKSGRYKGLSIRENAVACNVGYCKAGMQVGLVQAGRERAVVNH